ncbi:hypothetical protein PFISCL1PPCAC_14052, partial [Pristionchus fissidentatus]
AGAIHRNFRLQLCSAALFYALAVLGRFIIFYVQYTGLPDEDEYSLDHCFAHILATGIAGLLGFRYVYVVNLKLYKDVQTAAHIDRYSVSRTFQIKENVEAVKV